MTELHTDIKEVEPSKLIPYNNNPKKHPESQVNKIASSIKNNGFVQPIVVDKNNEVIIGHGRLQASKKLGLDKVPVIKHESLSEAEVKALRLADNRIAESGWEEEQLAVELEQLTESDDFEDLIHGFNDDEISEYLDSLTDETDLEDPETEDPETVETDIQEGEIFKLGRHRLMCGDSTNDEHVKALMDGEKADMVFTDPPYGIEFQSNSRDNKFDELKNDDKILDFTDKLERFAGSKAHRYICTGEQVYPVWRELFSSNYKNTLIWDKGSGGMGDLENDYAPQYEMIIYCNPSNTSLNGSRDSNVWSVKRDDVNSYSHPTQKPVELPAKAIKNSSNQGDIVLDLFTGSGSTLLAAEQTGRKAFCMELDSKYCQVIVNRWESLTGKQHEVLEQV